METRRGILSACASFGAAIALPALAGHSVATGVATAMFALVGIALLGIVALIMHWEHATPRLDAAAPASFDLPVDVDAVADTAIAV